MQGACEEQSQAEREDDAQQARQTRYLPERVDLDQIQMKADQEYEQHQANLAQFVQHGQTLRREQTRVQGGGDPSEERGSQQQACNDFPGHRRLTKAAGESMEEAADGKDPRDLQEQENERHFTECYSRTPARPG